VEQYFTSLSKRQTMLLLTSLAFGGSEAVAAFDHLDPSEEELLKHRAQSLLQIPRDKRIPLLVQEIKRLVTQRRRQLASAEPRRLAALLKRERGSIVEVVLNALPGDLAAAVRNEMGNPPPIKLQRDVKPEVLSIVRWKLEDALRSNAPQVGSFRFTDLLMMQQREILAVADRMGARVLATAIAGLNDEERTAYLGKLPPDQRTLAARAAEAGAARRLTEKDARLVLEMHGAIENPSLGLRSAGVQRIVRACYAQGGEFAQRFAERAQGDTAKLIARWMREEKGKPVKGDGGRLDIVEQLERLAQKGIVDRPMRLPPPAKPPPAPPVLKPSTSSPSNAQSKVLVAPPARRPTGNVAAPPDRRKENVQAGVGRQDPVAARAARRAGAAASGVVPSLQRGGARPTDSQARQRVLRDGKPLDTVPPRRSTSPVQEIPRRKEPPGTNPHRSPVVKGTGGRGPGNNGSR
jgi:hypothetical protein